MAFSCAAVASFENLPTTCQEPAEIMPRTCRQTRAAKPRTQSSHSQNDDSPQQTPCFKMGDGGWRARRTWIQRLKVLAVAIQCVALASEIHGAAVATQYVEVLES